MSFNKNQCIIPTIYCGKGSKPKDKKEYIREGDRYECLQKGFGAGMWKQRKQDIGEYSLLQITYVNEKIETNFKNNGIRNLKQLQNEMKKMNENQKKKFLKKVCKINNSVNKKAYNSILLYLNDNKVKKLPKCYGLEDFHE